MTDFYKVIVTKIINDKEFIGDISFGVHNMKIHNQKFKSLFTAKLQEGKSYTLFIQGKDDNENWLCKEVFIF